MRNVVRWQTNAIEKGLRSLHRNLLLLVFSTESDTIYGARVIERRINEEVLYP
jgi:hypothetical protein